MPSYCRVFAECFFRGNLKEAEKSVSMGFLVAETGFEPMTFGNSVSVHLQCVSNIILDVGVIPKLAEVLI